MHEVTLTLSSESLDVIQDMLDQVLDEMSTAIEFENLLIATDLKCPICKHNDCIGGTYNCEGDLIYTCGMCGSKFFYDNKFYDIKDD
jgi:transposase-like protein